MEVDTPVIQPSKYTYLVSPVAGFVPARSCPPGMRFESVYVVPHGRLWICMTLLMTCGPFFKGFCLIVWSHLLQSRLLIVMALVIVRLRGRLSSSLLEAIRRKQRAKRKAELYGDSNDLMDYKQLKNYLKICTRQAKLSYIQQLISEARRAPHLSGQL